MRALIRWLRRSFSTVPRTAVSLIVLAGLAIVLPGLIRWGVTEAVWTGGPAACVGANGACWAFIGAKLRFILLGLYPPGESWRPVLVFVLLSVSIGCTAVPRLWSRWLAVGWIASFAATLWLMGGGGPLALVPAARWGGLPLTLLLTVVGLGLGLPLGILLALARRSSAWAIRWPATIFIECVRGVPLVVVLYFASIGLPLLVPAAALLDKLALAQIGLAAFAAAYCAEVVRGGLQAVSPGQAETARSLGLNRTQAVRLIVLPQALRHVVPALSSTAIGFFQDTSLVAIIGVFDLLSAARTATLDPEWLGHYDEAFLFVGLIYFGISALGSWYAAFTERHMRIGGAPPVGEQADIRVQAG